MAANWDDYEGIARALILARPEINGLTASRETIVKEIIDLGLVDSDAPPSSLQLSAICKKMIMLKGKNDYIRQDNRPACLD